MIKTYFKIAWRNLFRNKSYNTINILGLAIGLASFISILLYLNYEMSYDKWDPQLKSVFKVSERSEDDIMPLTAAPLAGFLMQNDPAVVAATSIQPNGDFEVLLEANNKKLYQPGLVVVDSLFLDVFPYRLIEGDARIALNQPNAVVLTREVSRKFFGDQSPMGQTIKFFNDFEGVVTGVIALPENPSHLSVQLLVRTPYEKPNKFWQNYSFQTYIRTKNNITQQQLENGINRFYYEGRLKEGSISYEAYQKAGPKKQLFVEPVPDIHNFPKYGPSNLKTAAVLLILAVLLLVAGAINFSNLAIAKSIGRAKEVGVRKILGSDRRRLVIQFMSETALQCLISLIIALIVVSFALPYINHVFDINLGFWRGSTPFSIIVQISICLLLVIFLSGLYPSLVLSRFNAAEVLKGHYSTGKKGMRFRNALIVLQFMVSGFFILAILVISTQMHYMQEKDKGFSEEQVVRINATQKTRDNEFEATRNALLSIPGVTYVAKTTKVPGDKSATDTSTANYKYEGKEYKMASVKVSTDYFKTLQVNLLSGRLFNDSYADQHTRTAIINETAARKLSLGKADGQIITFPYCDSVPVRIIGIVRDFNIAGFERAVQPTVFTIGNNACMFQSGGAILVKLSSAHAQQSLAAIQQAWKKIEPEFPIRYSFVDEDFQRFFVSYNRLQQLISFFGAVAILISSIGLFALTAFYTRQRAKEIGVRKVLGATVANLTTLVGKDFVYMVLLSIIIITPVTWWAMHRWLETFAYRITMNGWMLAAAGAITMIIALATVSFQAIKAAMANPVKSLRTE